MEVKERNYAFDNLKGILIFLVVFGHFIGAYATKNMNSIVYDIYIFIGFIHMPFFVLISGYFSKKKNIKGLIEFILLYISLQMLVYPLFTSIFKSTTYIDNLKGVLEPQYFLWYMLALIFWRTVTPYIAKIKFYLPLSFVFGILIGFIGGELDLSFATIGRFFSLYPFFLLGYSMDKDLVEKLKLKIPYMVSVVGLALTIFVSLFFLKYAETFASKSTSIVELLAGRKRFSEYLTNPYVGVILKINLYIIQVVFIYLALILAKNKKTILCKIGSSSLLIYVSHGLLVKLFEVRFFEKYNIKDISSLSFLIGAFLISALYCFVLSLSKVKKVGNMILKLPYTILSFLYYKLSFKPFKQLRNAKLNYLSKKIKEENK